MDLTETTAPKSDQQNFDDYISGPKTVTITEVRQGSAEQPVEIHLHEFPGRPYKPSKSMRRVLIDNWGADTKPYTGRRMTLYGDPTVKFGAATVGGIKISHLSHIEKPKTTNLTVSKGRRAPHAVQPLPDAPTTPTEADVATNTNQAELANWWRAHTNLRPIIEARVAQLNAAEATPDA